MVCFICILFSKKFVSFIYLFIYFSQFHVSYFRRLDLGQGSVFCRVHLIYDQKGVECNL